MKLKIIGFDGGYPAKNGACSCYLLTLQDGTQIVLDMGNGALARLQNVIALDEIDAIILSHLHYDHMADACVLRHAIDMHAAFTGVTAKKIKIFLPATPAAARAAVLSDKPYYEAITIEDGASFALGDATVTFCKMSHPVEAYGVKIVENGKKFVYTGDTNKTADLQAFLQDADLALIEAGGVEEDDSYAHLSIKEAKALAEAAGVKQTILTHIHPLADETIYKQAEDEKTTCARYGAGYDI